MLHIFVDADACPVKEEVFRVAKRYSLNVTLVANSWMRVPEDPSVALKVVGGNLDEADDWIVGQVQPQDIVITIDVLLADRCLKKGSFVIGSSGKSFTEDNIGDAVATRNLMADLRDSGEITAGPAPFKKSDRSSFLQELNEVIQRIQRQRIR
ncbi:MAG: YaiI/YqxD family protein [Candidatus Omnitrophota bacterium]